MIAKKARMSGQIKAGKARLSSVVLGAEPATGDAVAGDVLTGKTFSNADDTGIDGAMPNIGAQNITPSASNQSISAGYHNGSGLVTGDADLVAGNIKKDAVIFGVTGTFEGDVSTYKTALDAANEEASVDLTAGIALVDTNYGEISAAIAAAGVSMSGVKPSGYDTKIAEAVYNACFVTVLGNIKDYNVAVGGTTANIPASVGGMAITAIGYGVTGALAAKGLVALTIPSGVVYIGTNAFYDNNIQNAVTVPEGVTVIEPSAFRSNSNLPGATLPNSLTDIKTYIFGDCDLISLILGNAVTAIAADAFRGNALPEITLPSTLLTIGNYAFYDSPIVKIIIGADVSIPNTDPYPTMGIYGSGFLTLYNGNGKLAGTYEYSAGTWSKTA